jgi:CRISPR system Cascade subunit CasA
MTEKVSAGAKTMSETFNLLEEPLIHAEPSGMLTLPGLLAALARDEVEAFPALRPHQGMFWHMFLVQLAALALHRSVATAIPQDEELWKRTLRGLTKEFPTDEPWCLVVYDWTMPAFMQPPVPEGIKLEKPVRTPDALDLLITSKNHDLKQAVARKAAAGDWIFALVSLQTGEGYGGAGNQGIARMNGGSSSRPMLTLAPRTENSDRVMLIRPGRWFYRDTTALLKTRVDVLRQCGIDFRDTGGLGLTWLVDWPENVQLQITEMDMWFIEVCRRLRLVYRDKRLSGFKGNSKATRINAKHFKGALGDPWAPVHKSENKSFTLSAGDFDYRTLTELMLGGDWIVPLLAQPSTFDTQGRSLLVAAALARGNSKTEGFKYRELPLSDKVSRALGVKRRELHELAQLQTEMIGHFEKSLSYALLLAMAGGEKDRISRDAYKYADGAREHLDQFADSIFFDHLWQNFEAQQRGPEALDFEKVNFVRRLWEQTQVIFEQTLPTMPCPSLFRPRAEARARRKLRAMIRKHYPELLSQPANAKEVTDAV